MDFEHLRVIFISLRPLLVAVATPFLFKQNRVHIKRNAKLAQIESSKRGENKNYYAAHVHRMVDMIRRWHANDRRASLISCTF